MARGEGTNPLKEEVARGSSSWSSPPFLFVWRRALFSQGYKLMMYALRVSLFWFLIGGPLILLICVLALVIVFLNWLTDSPAGHVDYYAGMR